MKFTIKHALVVAICALCICVVATGTVVAVTLNRTQAAAAGDTLTIHFRAGNHAGATYPLTFRYTNDTFQQNWNHSGDTTIMMVVGSTTAISPVLDDPRTLVAMQHNGRLINMPHVAGTSHFNAGTSGGVHVSVRPTGWHGQPSLSCLTLTALAPGTVYLIFQGFRLPIATDNQTVVRMHNNTGTLVTTQVITKATRTVDDALVVTGGYANATRLGRPMAVATNFRGWSYRQGGPLTWPVGLPILFTHWETNLFAVNA